MAIKLSIIIVVLGKASQRLTDRLRLNRVNNVRERVKAIHRYQPFNHKTWSHTHTLKAAAHEMHCAFITSRLPCCGADNIRQAALEY